MTVSSRSRKAVRLLIGAVAALLVLLGAGYAGIAVYSAHVLTSPNNRPIRLDPRRLGRVEPWSARTPDGLTIRGWYLPTVARRRLVVGVHGMGMNREELAGVGRDLRDRGFDVLLIDLRGHGSSDPARLSMGRRERDDLRAALDWARSEGFAPDRIGWLGYSLGASTILLEGLRDPEVGAVVLDSPFGDLPALLNEQLTLYSGLPAWFNPGILLAARLVYGVRTDDLVPARLASGWGDRPMLLIHGTADSIVPYDQGRAIAEAVGPACVLVTLPGVEHAMAYRDDRIGYVDRLDRFFGAHLGPPAVVLRDDQGRR